MQEGRTNRVWRSALSVVCFTVMFALAFSRVSALLQSKVAVGNVGSLYVEPKDSVDVVFLGTSRVVSGIYPTELFTEYGIAANNFAQNGQPFAVTYYALLEAIEQQHPKVAVVDIGFVSRIVKTPVGMENAHQSLDHFRNPIYKAQAIIEAIPSEMWPEFLLPFLAFHSRWEEVRQNDFSPSLREYKKGANAVVRTLEEPLPPIEQVAEDEIEAPSPEALSVLERFYDTCEEKDIELLFMVMPYWVKAEEQLAYHWVRDWAEERQVRFLYLSDHLEEIGFSMETDMRDKTHTNYAGGSKVTAYVGAYLKEHYDLPDRREDETYRKSWEYAAERFASDIQAEIEVAE